jgi:hypothetical protein
LSRDPAEHLHHTMQELVLSKCCTHQRHFQFAEEVKSDRAESGEKAGCGARVNRFALR